MPKFFNIHTAYLLIGLLYVLLPIMSWAVLAKQRRMEVTLWCFGGIVFGVGAMLIGLRPVLAPVLTYTLAVGLLWYGLAMKVDALKLALHEKSDHVTLLLSGIVYVVVYEFFRSVWPNSTARFTVGLLSFVLQSLLIAYLSFAFYKREKLQSLLWLFFTFLAAAGLNTIKLALVLLGFTEPDVTSGQADGILTVLSGLLLAVVSNFAFVGLYLERAVKEQESKLSQQVAQLERQHSIGMMAASFAHELSQPLTSISLDLENIKSQNNTEGIQKEQLNDAIEEIEKTLGHSRHLISRIRDYIEPQTKNHESTELVALLYDVARIVDYEKRNSGVTFQYNLPLAQHVWCDKVEISQIVLNVYRNAIEAMQVAATRVLTISMQTAANVVVIQFKDTGVGITESVQPNLGHAFFTTKDHGLGVGLSISKAIAEKHGGELTIANSPESGAEVTLRLPLNG
jgi:signal transduction histidine kinase